MKRTKQKRALRDLVAMALLVAISIVCGKYLAIPGGDILRFSFENLPIIMAGMLFGPAAGVLVGVVADLVGCVLVGYTVNPLVTAGAAAIGMMAGFVWTLLKKGSASYGVRIAITVAAAHIVGSVLIKTFGLAAFYAIPVWLLMLWRLLNYVIVGALEGVVLYFVVKVLMRQLFRERNAVGRE